jgi:hypothetical protein
VWWKNSCGCGLNASTPRARRVHAPVPPRLADQRLMAQMHAIAKPSAPPHLEGVRNVAIVAEDLHALTWCKSVAKISKSSVIARFMRATQFTFSIK